MRAAGHAARTGSLSIQLLQSQKLGHDLSSKNFGTFSEVDKSGLCGRAAAANRLIPHAPFVAT